MYCIQYKGMYYYLFSIVKKCEILENFNSALNIKSDFCSLTKGDKKYSSISHTLEVTAKTYATLFLKTLRENEGYTQSLFEPKGRQNRNMYWRRS